jgi:hypothetical protein
MVKHFTSCSETHLEGDAPAPGSLLRLERFLLDSEPGYRGSSRDATAATPMTPA